MEQAANAVCGDRLAGIHLALEAKARACRASVVADIHAQVEAQLAMAPAPVRVAALR
jgi:UrcA family protein